MNSRLDNVMNIGELAAAAGQSRRAVRFYVERGLVAPPQGRGRGCQYDHQHLEQLRRVRELQSMDHSLDAIKRIQNGEAEAPPEVEPAAWARARHRATLTARLWTRIEITEGVELHLDANKHNP